MKWFYCMDMHSGGGRKTPFEMYFIEAADMVDAERIFNDETGEDINDVCCECCGSNFSLGGGEPTLEEATVLWRRELSVEEYVNNKRNLVKVISHLKPDDMI